MTVALAAKFARCFRYAATTRAVRPSTRYKLITDSEKLTSAPLRTPSTRKATSGSNKT